MCPADYLLILLLYIGISIRVMPTSLYYRPLLVTILVLFQRKIGQDHKHIVSKLWSAATLRKAPAVSHISNILPVLAGP